MAIFVYMAGEGRGEFAWHLMPAIRWGIPERLLARGFEAIFVTPGHGGWDGQFHFYVANDLLGHNETLRHLDAPIYRYQRIGLSLLAKVLSVLVGSNWVSPFIYWLTSVLLVSSGTVALAVLLGAAGLPRVLALLWALSAGVQVTVTYGLPDAAADSLMILALLALRFERRWLYALACSLAILTREQYVIVAAGCFIATLIRLQPRSIGELFTTAALRRLSAMAAPGILLLLWQGLLYTKFGMLPSQAPGVAGSLFALPMAGWWQTIVDTYRGTQAPPIEHVLQPLHMALILVASLFSVVMMWRSKRTPFNFVAGAAFALLALFLTTLGPGVTTYWTGYFKATAILILPILLGLAESGLILRIAGIALLGGYMLVQQVAFWQRVGADAPHSINQYSIIDIASGRPAGSFPAELPCLNDYRSALHLISIRSFDQRQLFREVFRRPRRYALEIEVENRSDHVWEYARGRGSTSLISRWVDPTTGQEHQTGPASVLVTPLAPGERRRLPLIVEVPRKAPNAQLVVTMLQTGCSWFDIAGDAGTMRLQLR